MNSVVLGLKTKKAPYGAFLYVYCNALITEQALCLKMNQ